MMVALSTLVLRADLSWYDMFQDMGETKEGECISDQAWWAIELTGKYLADKDEATINKVEAILEALEKDSKTFFCARDIELPQENTDMIWAVDTSLDLAPLYCEWII